METRTAEAGTFKAALKIKAEHVCSHQDPLGFNQFCTSTCGDLQDSRCKALPLYPKPGSDCAVSSAVQPAVRAAGILQQVSQAGLHVLQADLWGRQVWTKEVDFKPKTYSFFWASDAIACARSSAGTLTLLKALQP